MTRVCTKCDRELEDTMFFKQRGGIRGLHSQCKDCKRVFRKRYRAKDKKNDPDYDRRTDLKRNHGLSIGDYDAMLSKQDGKCAIHGGVCKSGRRLAVDHDHETGKIRELLCGQCNQALGLLRESVEVFERAIRYLKKHGKGDMVYREPQESMTFVRSNGNTIATEPFPDRSVQVKEMSPGLIAPKQKIELASLLVVFGDEQIRSGWRVLVPAHLYTKYKQQYDFEGKPIILLSKSEVLLIDTRMCPDAASPNTVCTTATDP